MYPETIIYHRDEQLNTVFITGTDGTVRNSYQYDAFGNLSDTIEQLPNRIRYTGQQYDALTGQYYPRARYYNPVLGRFMQEDTYQGDGLNLYAYCKNNPMAYYDPSGYNQQNPDSDCVEAKFGEDEDIKTVNGYEAKVNVGQQNKHIPETNEYENALNNGQIKSIMYGDANDIQNYLMTKQEQAIFLE